MLTLQWSLYMKRNVDDPNENWVLVPGSSDPVYNRVGEDRYFEFAIPALVAFPTYNYIKAVVTVVTNSTPNDVVFTDFQAVQLISASETTEQTTYTTDLTLGYMITPTLVATSTLNLLYADDYSNQNVHANLRWSPSPYVGLSLGYSENRQESDYAEDQIDRTYSITVPTYPLPTLNIVLGATRIESYDGSRQTQNMDSYSLNSSGIIYPDLTAGMSLVYAEGTREEFIGQNRDSESFSARATLVALTQALVESRIDAQLLEVDGSCRKYCAGFDDESHLSSLGHPGVAPACHQALDR